MTAPATERGVLFVGQNASAGRGAGRNGHSDQQSVHDPKATDQKIRIAIADGVTDTKMKPMSKRSRRPDIDALVKVVRSLGR
jgi:hypothetical protein